MRVWFLVVLATGCSAVLTRAPERRTRYDIVDCPSSVPGRLDVGLGLPFVLGSAVGFAGGGARAGAEVGYAILAVGVVGIGVLMSGIHGTSTASACRRLNQRAEDFIDDFVDAVGAAQRGDCAMALRITERVRREDPWEYNARYAKQPDIGRCAQHHRAL